MHRVRALAAAAGYRDDDDCHGAAEDVEILSESEGDIWFGVDAAPNHQQSDRFYGGDAGFRLQET